MADKLAKWREEDRGEKAEEERRLRGTRWGDDDDVVTDGDEMSEDEDEVSEEMKEFKVCLEHFAGNPMVELMSFHRRIV